MRERERGMAWHVIRGGGVMRLGRDATRGGYSNRAGKERVRERETDK
jgi:hypothetical protein